MNPRKEISPKTLTGSAFSATHCQDARLMSCLIDSDCSLPITLKAIGQTSPVNVWGGLTKGFGFGFGFWLGGGTEAGGSQGWLVLALEPASASVHRCEGKRLLKFELLGWATAWGCCLCLQPCLSVLAEQVLSGLYKRFGGSGVSARWIGY